MNRTTGLHHVAYACKNGEETRHFYEDVLGFPLVHTEVTRIPDTESWFRHLFFDLGDGSCIAFFEMNKMGEKDGWRNYFEERDVYRRDFVEPLIAASGDSFGLGS